MRHYMKLYSINGFLNHAKNMYHLNNGQVAGFRALMKSSGHSYVNDPHKYIKPLRWYITH